MKENEDGRPAGRHRAFPSKGFGWDVVRTCMRNTPPAYGESPPGTWKVMFRPRGISENCWQGMARMVTGAHTLWHGSGWVLNGYVGWRRRSPANPPANLTDVGRKPLPKRAVLLRALCGHFLARFPIPASASQIRQGPCHVIELLDQPAMTEATRLNGWALGALPLPGYHEG